jgi:hypothetical protein
MSQVFWDQLWSDSKYAVLARSRAEYDRIALLHHHGKRAEALAATVALLERPEANLGDALEHAWGHLKGEAHRPSFEASRARGQAKAWLFEIASGLDARLANSRLLWSEPWPDRCWYGSPLRLGIAEGGGVRDVPLEEALAAPDAAAVLCAVRVAGRWWPNPLVAQAEAGLLR